MKLEEQLLQERIGIALHPEKLTHPFFFHETHSQVQVLVADTEQLTLHNSWQTLPTWLDHGFCPEDDDATRSGTEGGAQRVSTNGVSDGCARICTASSGRVDSLGHHANDRSHSCSHMLNHSLPRGSQGGEIEQGLSRVCEDGGKETEG
eukprot:3170351-Karenia_brevis.AAC.1